MNRDMDRNLNCDQEEEDFNTSVERYVENNNRRWSVSSERLFEHVFTHATLPCVVYGTNDINALAKKYTIKVTENALDGERSKLSVQPLQTEDQIKDVLRHMYCSEYRSRQENLNKQSRLEAKLEQALEIILELIQHSQQNSEIQLTDMKDRIAKLHTIIESLQRKNWTTEGDHPREDGPVLSSTPVSKEFKCTGEPSKYYYEAHEDLNVEKAARATDPICSPSCIHDDDAEFEDWKIVIEDWEEILITQDDTKATRLLEEGKLPDGSIFPKIYSAIKGSPQIAVELCKAVCCFIKTLSQDIVEAWPGYKFGDDALNPVFVVFTNKKMTPDDLDRLKSLDYNIYHREWGNCSQESAVINRQEQEQALIGKDNGDLVCCINEKGGALMEAHSNITMISAGSMKSIGFNTKMAQTEITMCIVLYTPVKGYIPLQEKPFPTSLGKFPVDVREAVFHPLGGGPNEYHDHVKMGCAIRSGEQDNGYYLLGSIGGFLDHPTYGLCCTTAAHALLSLERIGQLGRITLDANQFFVFQPVCNGARSFGSLVEAVYKEGNDQEAGVEAALIKINNRAPLDGDFPESVNYEENGFSKECPMLFRSGRICEVSDVKVDSTVVKYGAGSDITRGVFRTKGGYVRYKPVVGKYGNFDFLLRNQLEILPVDKTSFAEQGDSGALVFVRENGELRAVGVLEGDMGDGRYMVTPIRDVLKAFGMPDDSALKMFRPRLGQLASSSWTVGSSLSGMSNDFSAPVFQRSSTFADSGIHLNTSASEESAITFIDGRLKSVEEDLTQKLAQTKNEVISVMDKKLVDFKNEFKTELKQLVSETLQQFFQK